jgi:hypothetical protein
MLRRLRPGLSLTQSEKRYYNVPAKFGTHPRCWRRSGTKASPHHPENREFWNCEERG